MCDLIDVNTESIEGQCLDSFHLINRQILHRLELTSIPQCLSTCCITDEINKLQFFPDAISAIIAEYATPTEISHSVTIGYQENSRVALDIDPSGRCTITLEFQNSDEITHTETLPFQQVNLKGWLSSGVCLCQ